MPTPTKGPRLGGGPAHERLLLAGLATQLFEHRSITTTEAKAKRLRPFAERLVTFAKRGDLAARRRVLAVVRDKGVVHELFTEIAPAVAEREGGYTRITKIGNRKGDNAPLAVIELVLDPLTARAATVREAEAATGRAARGNRPAAAASEPTGAEPVAVEPGAAVADPSTDPASAEPAPAAEDAGLPEDASSGDTSGVDEGSAGVGGVDDSAGATGATTAEATPAEPLATGTTGAPTGTSSPGAPAGTAGTIDDPAVTERSADTPDSPPTKA